MHTFSKWGRSPHTPDAQTFAPEKLKDFFAPFGRTSLRAQKNFKGAKAPRSLACPKVLFCPMAGVMPTQPHTPTPYNDICIFHKCTILAFMSIIMNYKIALYFHYPYYPYRSPFRAHSRTAFLAIKKPSSPKTGRKLQAIAVPPELQIAQKHYPSVVTLILIT